jgi:hypothetical protein
LPPRAVNTGDSARKGWEGKGSTAELLATLDAISKQRTADSHQQTLNI